MLENNAKLKGIIHMEQKAMKEIESIRDKIECQKDFRCIKSDMNLLCEAKDMGVESMLECLDENPDDCKFSFAFYGYSHFCECPVRVYICKNLKK
jgi:spore coat polysaccharide biosynthesis protein SpsF (cytidylyltransferase family)